MVSIREWCVWDKHREPSGQSIQFGQHCMWTLHLQESVDPILGGDPDCSPEPKNDLDRHAVRVKKDGDIIATYCASYRRRCGWYRQDNLLSFASSTHNSGVNSRAATKWGAATF